MAKSTVMVGGLGGQGVLLFGQMLAQSAMTRYKYVTYFPNYGGLVRGGSSECTVSFSDEEVNSPIFLNLDVAVAMNPAYASTFEKRIKPGGVLLVDSTVVPDAITRKDIRVYSVPATGTAVELGDKQVANLVLLGAYLKLTNVRLIEDVEDFLEKKLGGGKNDHLLALDKRALRKGLELVDGNPS